MDDATPARWAWVPDYEGLYRASDQGDVWSEPRATTRGGILKQATTKANGYRWVNPSKDGVQRPREVHKIVMEAFVGPCPEGQEVRHLDGNPANNRWAPGDEAETVAAGGNLIYGTHGENMQDKHRHGTTWQLNVTHCPQDHEYTPENTVIYKSGSRACLTCKREKGLAAYYAKKKAENPDYVPRKDLTPEERAAQARAKRRATVQRYNERKRSQEVEALG